MKKLIVPVLLLLSIAACKEDKKPDFKKEGDKKPFKPKGAPAKKPFGQGKPSDKKQKPESPVERFKFNSGKTKK